MAAVAYVNGRYMPHASALVHVEDRGYQFADGVYEYIAFYNRVPLDLELHLARLMRSLHELHIAGPEAGALRLIIRELIERNGREDGGLYLQVTRGVARRDHPFPRKIKPALVMTVCTAKLPKDYEVREGVEVITLPDTRWDRRDIKSVSLLANVLAKQEASLQGVREAWLYGEDGGIREGSVSNAYIISEAGEIITHPADKHILGGVVRDVVLKIARKAQIPVVERAFGKNEIAQAAEAFITSTSANILPVVTVDGKKIGGGRSGPVTRRLQELYAAHVIKQTGKQL